MATKVQRKAPYRIQWNDEENIVCFHLVNHGLHGDTIARATGLSRAQVYYRAKRLGSRLRDYRDGRGPVASVILRRFTVNKRIANITSHQQELREELSPVIKRRLQERRNRK